MMGPSGISFGSLLLIALVAFLLFGGKRFQHLGEDLAAAIKGFKRGIADSDASDQSSSEHKDV
jgi:TatA/E family protein of Tat protein translocase